MEERVMMKAKVQRLAKALEKIMFVSGLGTVAADRIAFSVPGKFAQYFLQSDFS